MEHRWAEVELAGEGIFTGRLSCGLPIIVIAKPGFARKHAAFAVRYGSFDRSFVPPSGTEPMSVPDGIAHFLEHKLFEGREGNALEAFSRRGAMVNAGTSHRFTFYYFTAATDFQKNLRLLMDFVRSPFLTDENVRKEQGIIAQEIRMYDDMPDSVRLKLLLEALFARHPAREHIAGTVDSIRRITPELLTQCFEAFYRPENMVLCAVGDLDKDQVWEVAEDEAKKKPAWCALTNRPERMAVTEPAGAAAPRAERRMPVGLPKVVLGFKEVTTPASGNALLMRDVTTDFLLDMVFGRASEAYTTLYDDGIIDESFFAYAGMYPDVGFAAIGCDTPRPDELVDRLREIADSAVSALTEADFQRAKRKFLGEFLRRFNTVEFLGTTCVAYHLSDSGLREAWNAIQTVELAAVRERAAELFSADRSAVAAVLPMAWDGAV